MDTAHRVVVHREYSSIMWFSHYALVCFTLASISVAEPVKYDPRESATVDQLGLKEGLVYLVRRRVMVSHDHNSVSEI